VDEPQKPTSEPDVVSEHCYLDGSIFDGELLVDTSRTKLFSSVYLGSRNISCPVKYNGIVELLKDLFESREEGGNFNPNNYHIVRVLSEKGPVSSGKNPKVANKTIHVETNYSRSKKGEALYAIIS
jgi:hypothetical protein